MRKFRHHLTYANVMVTVLAFMVFAGGAAYAANTVFSADIVDGQVRGVDIGDNQVGSEDVRNQGLVEGGLTAIDIQNSALTGGDIAPESLRGTDVLDGTIRTADIDDEGPHRRRRGQPERRRHLHPRERTPRASSACFDPDATVPWSEALAVCADREMRLPGLGEAMSLPRTTTSPDVQSAFFWTDESFVLPRRMAPTKPGSGSPATPSAPGGHRRGQHGVSVLCVTTPTN